MDAARLSHPLQANSQRLSDLRDGQEELIRLDRRPSIDWNTQAKIQSESIGLSFDNPMFPTIEIPLYSAQSALEAKYVLYDGGISHTRKLVNKAAFNVQSNQLDAGIDQVRKDVMQTYFGILFLVEKDKVLTHSLSKIQDHIKRLEAALNHGIVSREDVDQVRIKAMELSAQIQATAMDKKALVQVLQNLTGMTLDEKSRFDWPEPYTVDPTDPIRLKEYQGVDLEIRSLEAQKELAGAIHKPKLYTFLSAGVGYPNPLNFFDDQVSPFAVGGIGFSWKFIDWGKTKTEKQQLKIRQDMLATQKMNLESQINRYNDKFRMDLEKFQLLIDTEKSIIEMRQSIADIQKSKLENGVIVPVEYLDTVNEIIDSELKLNQYQLEKLRTGLEYALLKGNL